MASFLKMENIRWGNEKTRALAYFNLEMKEGEINVLLGARGSAKTTILRTIAGLEKITQGKIVLKGNHISTPEYMVPIYKRDCLYLPREQLLFPHLSVAQNIQLPLRFLSFRKRKAIVNNVLDQVGLGGYENTPAHRLSRAEELCVALARSLTLAPSLLLINTPHAYTVASDQIKFMSSLRSLLIENKITALIAMEDQADAFAIADKIGIMHDGELKQWGSPYNIYHEPQHRSTVKFIGEGVLLKGNIQSGKTISSELGTIRFDQKPDDIKIGMKVEFLLYPDDLVYNKKAVNRGVVVRKEFQGAMTYYTLRLNQGSRVQCLSPSHMDLALGSEFRFKVSMDHLVVFKQTQNTAIDLASAHTI